MLSDTLGLDAKDVQILNRLMREPDASQAALAKQLKLSQPSVHARVQKLRKRGLLAVSSGIELNKTNMVLARVDFTARNAERVLESLSHCTFFVNGFVMSGRHNASVLILASDLKKIEAIITQHLRSSPDIKDIHSNVVVSTAKPFICSVDLEQEQHHSCKNKGSCDSCSFVHVKH